MENNHRFFSNKRCMFFPCHEKPDEAEFNCLFCYCPLYPLGDDCKGIFTWAKHEDIKIKICSNCHLPHTPKFYDTVVGKLTEERLTAMMPGKC